MSTAFLSLWRLHGYPDERHGKVLLRLWFCGVCFFFFAFLVVVLSSTRRLARDFDYLISTQRVSLRERRKEENRRSILQKKSGNSDE